MTSARIASDGHGTGDRHRHRLADARYLVRDGRMPDVVVREAADLVNPEVAALKDPFERARANGVIRKAALDRQLAMLGLCGCTRRL